MSDVSLSRFDGGIFATWVAMTRPPLASRAAAAVVLAAGLLAGACASPTSPTAPSSSAAQSGAGDVPASSVRLTVRVLIRAQESPISGAVVTVDGATSKVDAAGTCEFNVR